MNDTSSNVQGRFGGGVRPPTSARARSVLVLVGLMLMVLVAGSRAQPAPVPQRIISIVPAVTEILFAIGAGPQVIAVSSFDHATAAASLPRVGALLDPDMERVFTLRPDLVILYGSQVDQQAQIRRAAIPVFSYRHGGLAHVTAMVREMGRRTGRSDKAHDVAEAIERELAAVRARVEHRKPPRTLLVFGREPDAIRNVYASGGVGFLHDMLEASGGENVLADVLREAAHPTSETILATAPEVIIEFRVDGATENESTREIEAWEQLSTVPAVRRGRVHVLTGNELVVPGPRVAEVTHRLARLLHPDAF